MQSGYATPPRGDAIRPAREFDRDGQMPALAELERARQRLQHVFSRLRVAGHPKTRSHSLVPPSHPRALALRFPATS